MTCYYDGGNEKEGTCLGIQTASQSGHRQQRYGSEKSWSGEQQRLGEALTADTGIFRIVFSTLRINMLIKTVNSILLV